MGALNTRDKNWHSLNSAITVFEEDNIMSLF